MPSHEQPKSLTAHFLCTCYSHGQQYPFPSSLAPSCLSDPAEKSLCETIPIPSQASGLVAFQGCCISQLQALPFPLYCQRALPLSSVVSYRDASMQLASCSVSVSQPPQRVINALQSEAEPYFYWLKPSPTTTAHALVHVLQNS